MNKILEVKNLNVEFKIENEYFKAVNNINLFIDKGEIVALVGESGCGKTQGALGIISLNDESAKTYADSIIINNSEVKNLKEQEWNTILGSQVSMIFQETMTALNPLIKIGNQIAENAQNKGVKKLEAKILAKEMLKKVGLTQTDKIYKSYPHQLSGGMRQRAMIALALINSPSLLIADEATTALDVTTQAQILNLIKDMNRDIGTAVLMITHDLEVVKSVANRVYVMYAGAIVENGTSFDIINTPLHPYTKALLNSSASYEKRGSDLEVIEGIVPPLEKRRKTGCLFYERCKKAMPICYNETPIIKNVNNQNVCCHLY